MTSSGSVMHERQGDARNTAIFRIATAISSCFQLQQVLELACQSVVELLGVDHSGLVRFSSDGTHGTVVAEYGDGLHARGMKIPFENSPAEEALVRSARLIVAEDIAICNELGPVRDILLGLHIRSILIVPIVCQDRVVGSFSLDTLDRRDFNNDDLNTCQELARLIAVALERDELFARVHIQSSQLKALRDAAVAVSSPLNRGDVLPTIIQQTVQLLNANDAGIYLYDPQEKKLRLAAVHQHADKRVDRVLALGEGMAGRLIDSGAPYLATSDYRTFSGRSDQFDDGPSFGAVLEVPIPAQDRSALGVLYVESPRGREFRSDEIQLLKWFAEQAAVSLRNSELVEAQRRGLQLLLQATHVVAESRVLATGLQKLAELIVQFMDNSFCRILLTDDSRRCLLPIAAYAAPLSEAERCDCLNHDHPIPISDWTGLSDVLQAGRPRLLRYRNERTRPNLDRFSQGLQLAQPVQSLLMIPLKLGDRLVGLIDIGEMRNEDLSPFTVAKQDLARAIADQVTVLIDRLHQHETAERRARLLNELEVFSGYLVAAKEPNRVLQEFLRLSTLLFPGTTGALFRNHRSLRELELIDVQGPTQIPAGQRVSYEDPLLGRVVRDGMAFDADPDKWPLGKILFENLGVRRFVATPLLIASDVEYILVVGDPTGKWLSPDPDLGILERLTTRAASALATSRLIHPDPRLNEQLTRLQAIGDYMQKAEDLDAILHAFLTGVTAGYALGFNRAAVFLVDDRREYLDGRKAIGEAGTWSDHVDTLNGFAQFIRARELGELKRPGVDEAVTKLHLPIGGKGVFSSAVLDKRWVRLQSDELDRLPSEFRDLFSPVHEVIVVPLISEHQAIGLVVVDNPFTGAPISDQGLLALWSFSHRAALTIHNRLVLEQALAAKERFRRLYEAGTRLLISENPRTVAQNFADELLTASDALSCSVIFIDEQGHVKDRIMAGDDKEYDPDKVIRQDGISMYVLHNRQAVFLEDAQKDRHRVNPHTFREQNGALVCLPLILRDRPIGVIWLNYRNPRRFTNEEKKALQLYAEQAAIAYASSENLVFSQRLHELAQAGPDRTDPKAVMSTIVELARQTFDAHSITLWPYDSGTRKFIPQELAAVGIGEPQLTIFRNAEPWQDHTTYTALREQYLEVTNIDDDKNSFLRRETRELLREVGVISFQACVLKIGEEPLGVLYVSYSHVRQFGSFDIARLETFSKSAAQVLKTARLVAQISKARQAAHAVAEIIALGQEHNTVRRIAEKTQEVMSCDAVVLFEFNQTTNEFTYPYTMIGVGNESWDGMSPDFPRNSWILDKLDLAEEEVVERVDEHLVYRYKRFAKDENIKSFVLVPLRAYGRKVGVMFVNYRHQYHRFTDEERKDLRLFAFQASVAIRNRQLFEERAALEAFCQKLMGCTTVEQIANAAVCEIARLFGTKFSDIVLPNRDGSLYVAAWVGWDDEKIRNIKLEPADTSHTVITIMRNAPVAVRDFADVEFAVPSIVREHELVCGMSGCLRHECRPIGALLTHSKTRREFGDYELHLLQAIADQTAIALQGVRRFEEEAERRMAHSQAMLDSTRAITNSSRGLESSKILAQILQQAVKLVDDRAFLCTAHRLQQDNEGCKELILEAVYPSQEHQRLQAEIGRRRLLTASDAAPARIGIAFRAAISGEAQLVPDTSVHSDYVVFSEETRCELAVPLFDPTLGEVVGVINVESRTPGSFNEDHKRAIKVLGEVAVIVMQNAREHEHLEKTITQLDARTTLAWIGMTTNHWRHDIDNSSITIRNHLTNMNASLRRSFNDHIPAPIAAQMNSIRDLTEAIQKRPITPPLSSEEGRGFVRVNELLRERANQLWAREPYAKIRWEPHFDVDDGIAVFVSREWLRRAIDLLIDNAVAELSHVSTERQHLDLITHRTNGGVEIIFRDRGRGIPPEVVEQAFRRKIRKSPSEPGLGVGLLMAQAIVEAYDGRLYIRETGRHGTSMAIWFPAHEC